MSQAHHVISNPGYVGAWVLGTFPNALFLWQLKRPSSLHQFAMKRLLGIQWHDGPTITFTVTVIDPPPQPAAQASDVMPQTGLKAPRFIQ